MTSEGEKMLLVVTLMGVGLSAVFSTWIINLGLGGSRKMDEILKSCTEIEAMLKTK